jgi:ABC-2 type transport system ATP-binding protein
MPVRKLSLGQRMRCDLVASLLHNPSVLFLDEPTIGLDVIGKIRIREFLGRVNREFNTTMILTTHDLDEIEKLCKRVIIIDHGKILYDGDLEGLRRQYSTDRRITFQMSSRYSLEELRAQVRGNGAVQWEKPAPLQLRATFRMEEITPAEVIGQVLQLASVHDITIEEASIEEIVGRIYSSGKIERDS